MVNDNNGGENVPWFEEHPFMFVARFHRIDPAPDIRIKSDLEVYADPGAIVPNTIGSYTASIKAFFWLSEYSSIPSIVLNTSFP